MFIQKGGVISESIFNLVLYSKEHKPNDCASTFCFRLKRWGTVIWFVVFLRMGSTEEYIPTEINPPFRWRLWFKIHSFYSWAQNSVYQNNVSNGMSIVLSVEATIMAFSYQWPTCCWAIFLIYSIDIGY